jgi:hypothetical protein
MPHERSPSPGNTAASRDATFPLQSDGTLRCPAGQTLVAHERRREADGSLRVVYAASIRSCRPCPLREQCQWQGRATAKPRQVSVLLHPLGVGPAPLLWRDWSRRTRAARVHRVAARPTGRGPGSVWWPSLPHGPTGPLIPPAAGALAAVLGRTTGAQCPCSNSWSGDDPPVRRPRHLRSLSRPGNGLKRLRRPQSSRSSDRQAAPSVASWLLALAGPLFRSLFCCFRRRNSAHRPAQGAFCPQIRRGPLP